VHEVVAPLEGKFYLTNSSSETAKKVGDVVEKGDTLCYIESMKTYNAITADKAGKIIVIGFANGESVNEDEVLFKLQ
jgi:pyruvate carboxylase subunit B